VESAASARLQKAGGEYTGDSDWYPDCNLLFAGKQSKGENMLGWMIVFALISAVGALSSMSGAPAASMKIASFLFASLFLLGLLTYAIRGRAR
jgi:uncharacterized membrane protein YtjA (UPF0391 family)